MMRVAYKLCVILVCSLVLFPVANANAQSKPDKEQVVEKISRLVHDNMDGTMVHDSQGKEHIVTKEDVAALEYPLLPYDVRKQIFDRGIISGLAKSCGLDWQRRSFEPFMRQLRATEPPYNDYQLAFAATLHGYMMVQVENEPCDVTLKTSIEKKILSE